MTPDRKIRQINASAEVILLSKVCKKWTKSNFFLSVEISGQAVIPGSIKELLDKGKKETLTQFYSKQAVINSLYALNNPRLQVALEN